MNEDNKLIKRIHSLLKAQLSTHIYIYFMILNKVNQLGMVKQQEIIKHLKDLWQYKTVRKHLYKLRKKKKYVKFC